VPVGRYIGLTYTEESIVAQPAKNKQQSKDQSRTVSTKKAPTKAGGRSNAKLIAWGSVGLVVVIVAVLVIVKLTSSSSNGGGGSKTFEPASASVVAQVTSIPTSVYNTVGINSSVASVTAPTTTKGQPALKWAESSLPAVFYYGAEYCPYCAAERWPFIAALSRFGTWSNLGNMQSSSTDVYPNTQTFTFSKASYSSPYISLHAVEAYANYYNAAGTAWAPLMTPTAQELKLVSTYDSHAFFPSIPANQPGSIPFLDFGNQTLIAGASYSPTVLTGSTRDQIAAGLSNASNPATQAIVATANYMTASICHIDGGKPGSVCTSAGVKAAAKALGY